MLESEVAELGPRERDLWDEYKVAIRSASLWRSAEYGRERVFVVAQIEDRVLFFDDVEGQFGVARSANDEHLQDCALYGELRYALRGLDEYAI